jgi:hypothetical protein
MVCGRRSHEVRCTGGWETAPGLRLVSQTDLQLISQTDLQLIS